MLYGATNQLLEWINHSQKLHVQSNPMQTILYNMLAKTKSMRISSYDPFQGRVQTPSYGDSLLPFCLPHATLPH